jgi:hypothetical protein
MRIAQIAPLAESVPPKLYGGTERVIAWLVDELIGLGHEVTLFASGDARTRAKLHPVWPQALRLRRPRADPAAACAALLEAVAQRANEEPRASRASEGVGFYVSLKVARIARAASVSWPSRSSSAIKASCRAKRITP